MSKALAALVVVLVAGPSARQAQPIDAAFVRQSVESVAAIVDREYFDADVASRVAAALRQSLAQHRYDGARTLDALATTLTRELVELTRDKHLHVGMIPERAPQVPIDADARAAARAAFVRRANAGVKRTEMLPGNVGYLNLTAFFRVNEARDAIAAAMKTLSGADALILDLRENAGGSTETVALLATYFFDEASMPLFTIERRDGSREAYATEAELPAEHDGKRPMYILTSSKTFSAGEGFAFILQERRRAEVIGETTAGAANPGKAYPVNTRLEVTVPNGRVRGAVSEGNWEGTGVVPDVKVPASDALKEAQARALKEIAKQAGRKPS